MSLLSWLPSLKPSTSGRAPSRRRPVPRKRPADCPLHVEALEERALLSLFGAQPPIALSGNLQAVAVGDLNRDGWSDLVVANSSGSGYASVLLGNGPGTFGAPISYGNSL